MTSNQPGASGERRSRPGASTSASARAGAEGTVVPYDGARLTLRSADDLLVAIPYLVGFRPEDSLVLVALDGSRQVVFTARLDLADTSRPECADALVHATRSGPADALLALVYGHDALSTGGRIGDALDLILGLADRTECDLLDVVGATAERWRSLLCTDPACCPAGGAPLPDPQSAAVAAEATLAGLVALPSRADLAATLDGCPEGDREALLPLLGAEVQRREQSLRAGRLLVWRRSAVRAVFAACRGAELPEGSGTCAGDDALVARLGVALSDVGVRDSVWCGIEDGRLPGRALWRGLAGRLPGAYPAAPLFLLGWRSWRDGEATFAGMAAERALAADPGYSAADLLIAALSRGVDPRRLPRLNLRRAGQGAGSGGSDARSAAQSRLPKRHSA